MVISTPDRLKDATVTGGENVYCGEGGRHFRPFRRPTRWQSSASRISIGENWWTPLCS
jgi:hypothetical protein